MEKINVLFQAINLVEKEFERPKNKRTKKKKRTMEISFSFLIAGLIFTLLFFKFMV